MFVVGFADQVEKWLVDDCCRSLVDLDLWLPREAGSGLDRDFGGMCVFLCM